MMLVIWTLCLVNRYDVALKTTLSPGETTAYLSIYLRNPYWDASTD
jgi:hypothetical protein